MSDTKELQERSIAYGLLYLLFLASLAPVFICVTLIRWPISRFQMALLYVSRYHGAIPNWRKDAMREKHDCYETKRLVGS